MAAKSSQERYGGVAITFHWVVAVLILFMFAFGFAMNWIEDPDTRLLVLRGHSFWGEVVLVLTLSRLIWRAFDPKPGLPAGMPVTVKVASRTTHALLYLVTLLLVASGGLTLYLSGAWGTVLGLSATPLPESFFDYTPRMVHRVSVWIFAGLLGLHVGAAVYHHWILRDVVLGRMLPFLRGAGRTG